MHNWYWDTYAMASGPLNRVLYFMLVNPVPHLSSLIECQFAMYLISLTPWFYCHCYTHITGSFSPTKQSTSQCPRCRNPFDEIYPFPLNYITWCPNVIVASYNQIKVYNSNRHHDDVIKWKLFPRYWPIVRRIYRSPVNSPHKGQWRGTLMFSLICAWIKGWVNNLEAGYLRRHRAHYDGTAMCIFRHYCV